MAETKQSEYSFFTKPAQLNKAVNTLRGLVAGLSADGSVSGDEVSELVHWCQVHAMLRDRHPFSEIIPCIEDIIENGEIEPSEKDKILWICSNFVDDSKYYDISTSTIQFLNGFAHGLLADGKLSDSEIQTLSRWIAANSFLKGTYPYDEISAIISRYESDPNELAAFLSTIIDFKDSANLSDETFDNIRRRYAEGGIYAEDPAIDFCNKTFCFTGESYKATRAELESAVVEHGGNCSGAITKKVDFLIVCDAGNIAWAHCAYGRKIEKAVCLRKQGLRIQIVRESDFWAALSISKD